MKSGAGKAAVATVAILVLGGLTAAALAKTTVGNATVVVQTVTGTLEDEILRIKLQDDIYHNEVIETATASASEVTFIDDTKITLGPNSSITVDRFVFDPNPEKAKFVLKATQGVLRFATGNMPKRSYVIRTPVSTIGVRGTIFTLVVLTDGTTNITVEEGEIETINCLNEKVELTTPGTSTTVEVRAGASCSGFSTPGPQPPEFSEYVEAMDLMI